MLSDCGWNSRDVKIMIVICSIVLSKLAKVIWSYSPPPLKTEIKTKRSTVDIIEHSFVYPENGKV